MDKLSSIEIENVKNMMQKSYCSIVLEHHRNKCSVKSIIDVSRMAIYMELKKQENNIRLYELVENQICKQLKLYNTTIKQNFRTRLEMHNDFSNSTCKDFLIDSLHYKKVNMTFLQNLYDNDDKRNLNTIKFYLSGIISIIKKIKHNNNEIEKIINKLRESFEHNENINKLLSSNLH